MLERFSRFWVSLGAATQALRRQALALPQQTSNTINLLTATMPMAQAVPLNHALLLKGLRQ